MQSSLALTALFMGLAGGPHCIAMCGAACAGFTAQSRAALWQFHAGRVIGYALLGALAAASMQGFGWLTIHSAALRPVWSLFHIAVAALGLYLLLRAEQPVWLERGARRLWQSVKARLPRASGGAAPLVTGIAWALLPCGLLYSAVLVAVLTGQAWQGATVMALFALGTAISMQAGAWLWLRLRGEGRWGIRLAGLLLAASSGVALWMGLVHETAPWCLPQA